MTKLSYLSYRSICCCRAVGHSDCQDLQGLSHLVEPRYSQTLLIPILPFWPPHLFVSLSDLRQKAPLVCSLHSFHGQVNLLEALSAGGAGDVLRCQHSSFVGSKRLRLGHWSISWQTWLPGSSENTSSSGTRSFGSCSDSLGVADYQMIESVVRTDWSDRRSKWWTSHLDQCHGNCAVHVLSSVTRALARFAFCHRSNMGDDRPTAC